MARIRPPGEPTVRDAPHPLDAKIAARIKQRRTFLDMSQPDLAKRIGVIQQQVQKYEAGVNRVAASRLWRIARVLNVDVNWFFRDAEGTETSDELDRHERVILNAYRKLKSAERKKAIKILTILAG